MESRYGAWQTNTHAVLREVQRLTRPENIASACEIRLQGIREVIRTAKRSVLSSLFRFLRQKDATMATAYVDWIIDIGADSKSRLPNVTLEDELYKEWVIRQGGPFTGEQLDLLGRVSIERRKILEIVELFNDLMVSRRWDDFPDMLDEHCMKGDVTVEDRELRIPHESDH